MVYHEVRKRENKILNYLIHNSRQKIKKRTKWVKKSKYLGEGRLSKSKIENEKKKFEIELKQQRKYRYISSRDATDIEKIRQNLSEYFQKAGSSGTEKFKEWLSTELTYNSNAIEGNTLSLRETSMIINEDIVPKGASIKEIYEARNHKDAIDFTEAYSGDLTEAFILQLHKRILKNIDDSNAGKYRKVQVYIRGSDVVLAPESLVPRLTKDIIKWYKSNKNQYHPFELAAIISMKFVTIHPFVDGNGRVSRLIMNFVLKKNQYPWINIYKNDRPEYMDAVRKANDKEYTPIIQFLIKMLKENYKHMGT